MKPVKQFIVFALTTDQNNPVVACLSRQRTKELAINEAYYKIEKEYTIKRTWTQELTVDEEGVIRLLDADGEHIPLVHFNFI